MKMKIKVLIMRIHQEKNIHNFCCENNLAKNSQIENTSENTYKRLNIQHYK